MKGDFMYPIGSKKKIDLGGVSEGGVYFKELFYWNQTIYNYIHVYTKLYK